MTATDIATRDNTPVTTALDHPPAAATAASYGPDFLSIPAMVDRIGEVATEKAANMTAHFVRALIGGAMVAFGVVLSINVSAGITVPGVGSAVMGLAFGFSFVLILASGASLITADMAAGFVALRARRIDLRRYLNFLGVGLVGNILGTAVLTIVAAAAGGPLLTPAVLHKAIAVGEVKSGAPFGSALLLATLCTWFLQTAMFLFFKTRGDGARMGFAFYGPFAFVAAGTQHVIANVGFIGLPLLLHTFHPGQVPDPQISWGFGGHGLLTNLVVTTLGNFAGAVVFVTIPFLVAARHLRHHTNH